MTPLAHISSGYLIYKLTAHPLGVNDPTLLLISVIGANTPDIDSLFGNKMKDHRNTIFHSPLFWIFLYLLLFSTDILGTSHLHMLNLFTLGVLIHLSLDWVSARTSGIRLFYPFSKKLYSLFPTQPEKGDIPVFPNKKHKEFWRFYLENKLLILFELIIITSPLFLLILSKLRS